jgi:hypothetical protein
MGCAMVGGAQSQEIRDDVQTAIGAPLDVVDVDVRRVGAARHLAAMPIASEHGPAQRGRNALASARDRGRAAREQQLRARRQTRRDAHVGVV